MKKKTIIALSAGAAAVILAVGIPLSVWGASRVQLNRESKTMISGTWKETEWKEAAAYNPLDEELYHTIDVKKGESFTLLALTDVHYRNGGWYGQWAINKDNRKTDRDIQQLAKEAKPDLIIVNGDIETGTLNDLNYEHFAEVMDGIGVPWTITFGNHDAEHRADKPAIMNVLQKSKHCIFRQGPTNLGIEKNEVLDPSVYNEQSDKYAGGLGNTVIHLRDPDTGEIYYAFILMDTGDWQNMYGNQEAKNRLDTGMRPFSRVGVGLTNRQISWYAWALNGLKAYNETKGVAADKAMPQSMFLCHIGMKAQDYATILSQYENSWGGQYTKGGYPDNDLPFNTDAEWSRPSDRPYIEYDSSTKGAVASNEALLKKVKDFEATAKEKAGNDAIKQYWMLANNEQRTKYINGENETYPSPKHISELVPVIDKEYKTHRENDLFLSKLLSLGSTKNVVTGHNHCDGFEVVFDGITYTSVVKTGDIYVDKEWDNNNRGGSQFIIERGSDGAIQVKSKAFYTRHENAASKQYPRPVQEW